MGTPVSPLDEDAPATRRRATGGLVLLVAIALRVWSRSPLWLDEAQSVSFARLPFTGIPRALRQDGAPPLYYMLLHIWMRMFGTGDAAVRSLSVVCSIGALIVLTLVARRSFGDRAAIATFVVMAMSPFAVRYGSETRMYALVMLEVATTALVVQGLWVRPSRRLWVAMALLVSAMLYTHYWALYLVAALAVVLVTHFVRSGTTGGRSSSLQTLTAVLAGGLLWLPWLPTFWFQSAHTATPWARGFSPGALADTIGLRFSGAGLLVPLYGVVVTTLVLTGVVRRVIDGPMSSIGITPRGVAAVVVGATFLAACGAIASNSAYTARYTSIMFPGAVLLAGVGVARLPRRAGNIALAASVLLGTALSVREIRTDRTTAATLAAALGSAASRDIVVYCPDQLGPALSRLVDRDPGPPDQASYPAGSAPQLVNWVDYEDRYSRSNAEPFASAMDAAHPDSTIWLVVSLTYPPTQRACADLLGAMNGVRHGAVVIPDDPTIADHGALWRFDPVDQHRGPTGWASLLRGSGCT